MRARRAAMVDEMREPPKELRDWGRLNCRGLERGERELGYVTYADYSNLSLDFEFDIRIGF